ncbi:MAG: GTP-binding protein [Candidatus Bathyarchaeota archaeon]
MPKFRQTSDLVKLMNKKEDIRNIGIIAHIDHGKTTMSDSLLAEAGLLSPKIAGAARALDYLEEEQKRGITIKSANISLLHEVDKKSHVINLIDTPGHVDFTGKVTRALRAIDGAVVVVDAVEEVMVQTETVTRQALNERVKPVLFINKVDRLIKELKLNAEQMQTKLLRIIRDFNNLISIYGEKEVKNVWKVDATKGTVAFGSALHKWGFTMDQAEKAGIKFSDVVDAYQNGTEEKLAEIAPLHNAILDMAVKNLPNPIVAQKYRVPKVWKGEADSKIGKAMINCDENGPVVMCLTSAAMDPHAGLVATGRIFSGRLNEGDRVYLVGAKKDYRVQQVSMYMGAFREVVGKMDPRDLPRLIELMDRLTVDDPNLVTKINKETGEYLLSGMGELHLEIAVKTLRQTGNGLELITSQPLVVYRETAAKEGVVAMAKSPNKHSRFWLKVEPLEQNVVDLMEQGSLFEAMGNKRIGETLREEAGWSAQESRNVWALEEHRNILLDLTKGVQYLREVKETVNSGFRWAARNGPLCDEPIRGCKVSLLDCKLHEDPVHRGPAQIMPAMKRALWGSFLTADPVLSEPIYKIGVSVPHQFVGDVTGLITRKRGRIVSSEQKGPITNVTGFLPVSETFGLSADMRGATSGHAFWQTQFDHWEKVPASISAEVIAGIRKRRGLPEDVPSANKFIDRA